MKKYTNKILIIGLLITLFLNSAWAAYYYYQLKKVSNEQETISNSSQAVRITTEMDENGNQIIRTERTENGESKIITVDPKSGATEEEVII